MSTFARTTFEGRYAWDVDARKEFLGESARRMVRNVLGVVPVSEGLKREIEQVIAERMFMPGGRYWANAGRDYHQVQNCLLLRAEDTREGWADLMHKVMMSSMTGAGIGVVYSDLRERGALLKRAGGYSSGPLALMEAVNEAGRVARAGGSRRGAIWAGLRWNHPDVLDFARMKNWPKEVVALKEKFFGFPATMDHTNISVGFDDDFFAAYAAGDIVAHEVYWTVIRQMCETGEPGISVNVGANAGEDLRNACTEITSRDDSDICNLGSVNLARIGSVSEMRRVVELGTIFLLAGTVYSDVPYPKVAEVRAKNRRLGLGLMGVHERYALDGIAYGTRGAYAAVLEQYTLASMYAARWADAWSISRPVKTRAIAPTGTIGIVAETTTGMEPLYAKAYKRRYLDHGTWKYQYVIDPTARKLVNAGVDPESIEDAYSIPAERRVAFQAQLQRYVDHGISSTINLPAWGSPTNNEDTVRPFGEMLLKYLPKLRGITAYPDGARGGQPLSVVSWAEATALEGQTVIESADICSVADRGSCGA